MTVIWNILRPRFWELRHQWQIMSLIKRLLTVLGILAITGVSGFIFVIMIMVMFGLRNRGNLASMLPASFYSIAFFMIIQLGDTLHQLYLSPDLFWLNQSPLSKRYIYLAKMIESTFTLWLPAVFSLGLLIAFGIVQGALPLYYPLALISLLSLLIFVTISGMILIMLLSLAIPPKNLRELIPAVLAISSLGGVFIQRTFFNRISSNNVISAQTLGFSLNDPLQMILVTLGLFLSAAVWVSFGYFIYSMVNERIYNAIQIVNMPKVKHAHTPIIRKNQPSSSSWLRFFPPDQLNIIIKDWTTLRRDPRRLTNLTLTPLMMIFFMVPSLGSNGFNGGGYWLMLFYAAIFTMSSGQGIALTAFTQEARVFSFIYRSPVSMSAVMQAKFWASFIPTALIWTLVLGGCGLIVHLPFWQMATITVLVLGCLLGNCVVMVAVSARSADLSAISRKPKLTGPMAWLAIGMGMIWNVFLLGLTSSLLFYLAGSTPLVRGLMSTIEMPALPAFIPLVGLLICLLGIILIGIPITLFWIAGLKRLRNWEQV